MRLVKDVAIVLVFALIGFWIASALDTRPEAQVPEHPTHSHSEHIEEDDPRWDCATMGNRQCGPAIGA